MHRVLSLFFVLFLLLAMLAPAAGAAGVAPASPDAPAANALRISQVYGGGGNSGATYTNDFIEIFNAGATAADLTGYSVQYASASGTSWQVTTLTGSLAAGQYYLIQEAAGTGGTVSLPTPDATGSIAISGSNGKVALVSNATALTGGCPTDSVVDFVGFGTANCYEGAGATPALTNTTAALRAGGGCTDTDTNSADFTTAAPAPRNTATATNACTVADTAPTVASTDPAANVTGVAVDANLTVTFSEPVTVAGAWYAITCATSGAHTAAVSGGPTAWTLNPDADFAAGESCTVTIVAAQVTDLDTDDPPDAMATDYAWSFTTAAPAGPIAIINELDADTPGTDAAEFIELYDGGAGSTPLDGLVLVLYNGSGDTSYAAFDLDGKSTSAAGYFVLCSNAANVANCDLDVSPETDLIQNGQDAAALYTGDATAFPNGTAVTVANLIDAIVYDTDDADDAGLLVLLNAGQPQVNENAKSNKDNESNQRCPNGSGGARNTDTYSQFAPTPGSLNICDADVAPNVASTSPISGATNVAINSDVSVTFSEPVTVAGAWYAITCATSGAHTAAVSGGPTAFTLNPDTDFAAGESCSVTIVAAQVTDQDGTPTPMAADYLWSFTTAATSLCDAPTTPIYAVQGNGTDSPLANTTVTVGGVVVADMQGAAGMYGFNLQEATGDGDPLTSDGVFIYVPDANAFSGIDVAVGDVVHLTGTAKEYNGLTEIDNLTELAKCGTGAVTATTVDLPELINGDLERYEGMLITIPETLTASQNYFQGRYGQVTLSADGRMYNPTNGNGLGDTFDLNARRILVLDDAYSGQNPNPIPYIGDNNTLRAGDTVAGLTGILDYGQISSDATIRDYRLQPTAPVSFTRVNTRTAAPAAVGGNVKVASFNVLNYFTTFGSRGANNQAEFDRQRTKIIAALQAINADVVGLMEIENNGGTAVGDLVNGLNGAMGAGTYAYVTEPAPGTDAIKVALIYKPAVVTPIGAAQNYQTSTATYNPLFDRPPLAQVFETVAFGERFTVVVNHFKSKGSCPTSGPDVEQGDGQGCWNAKRTAQAGGLLDFITLLQTNAQDGDVLVIGDLNSYGAEDPINTLTAGGLVNEVARIAAATRYSYIFDGFSGYLDHGLATPSLDAQISGQTIWHINADEPSVIDYNTEFKPQDLYTPTPYRSSDHDPVIVGLGLYPDLSDAPTSYALAWHTGQGALRLGSLWTHEATTVPGADDASDDGVTPAPGYAWNVVDGGQVVVTVTGGAGYLSAWMDWNSDGAFTDSERAITNATVTAGPAETLSFSVPAGVTVAGTLNVRFRLYAAAQVEALPVPGGRGDGGEVEDYTWSFGPNAVSIRDLHATSDAASGWPALGYLAAALGALFLKRKLG